MSCSLHPLAAPIQCVSGIGAHVEWSGEALCNANAPRLSTSDAVEAMFIFFQEGDFAPNKTLDVGEVLELELEYEAVARGEAEITCHVHATVDVDDVFPRSGGSNGEGSLRVLAA